MDISSATLEVVAALGPRRGSPPAASGGEPLLLLIPFLGVCFLVLALTLAYLVATIRAFRREMGLAITALGLAPQPWLMRGIQAQGAFRGRPIEVRSLPDARYTPAMLEVKLATRASRTFVVGAKKGAFARGISGLVSGLTDRVDVPLGGPWLERGVSADDPGFASAFLQSPVGEIVYRLTQAPLSGQVRFLKVSPGEVVLLVSGFVRSTTNPTTLHAWVSDLASIAEALEGP